MSQPSSSEFPPVSGAPSNAATVSSLCMNCEETGETRLLFVQIPHFREIIVSSFSCEECGYTNQNVQFGGEFAPRGKRFILDVTRDTLSFALNRQIVKSKFATMSIQELGLEIPRGTQGGVLSTLEGLLRRVCDDLSALQPVRKIQDPVLYEKIEGFVGVVMKVVHQDPECVCPFSVVVDDPAGNSNVEKRSVAAMAGGETQDDGHLRVEEYVRSAEVERTVLGIGMRHSDAVTAEKTDGDEGGESEGEASSPPAVSPGAVAQAPGMSLREDEFERLLSVYGGSSEEKDGEEEGEGDFREVHSIPQQCYSCSRLGECRMLVTNIPHFKETIIMSFSCVACGYKTNEIKGGGAVSPKGKRITLRVADPEDLSRDFLKAETATILIPDIELEVTQGSMGGRFTTVEGLLVSLKEEFEKVVQFDMGDSAAHDSEKDDRRAKMEQFFSNLTEFASGERPFTLVVDDPMANSFVQDIYFPDPDPNLTIEEYTRTTEQDEEFGLLDMKTEDYGQDDS